MNPLDIIFYFELGNSVRLKETPERISQIKDQLIKSDGSILSNQIRFMFLNGENIVNLNNVTSITIQSHKCFSGCNCDLKEVEVA